MSKKVIRRNICLRPCEDNLLNKLVNYYRGNRSAALAAGVFELAKKHGVR